MVQIGNFHRGTAENAKLPVLTAGEAYLLWDNLRSRYDIIMATQLFVNHVHDLDFKTILKTGLTKTLEKHVNTMEKEMNKYQLTMPQRPPKSIEFQFIPFTGAGQSPIIGGERRDLLDSVRQPVSVGGQLRGKP